MRANIRARRGAVALETIQDNLSSLLAPVQVLIAVFSSRAPDEVGALVQVAAFGQGGGRSHRGVASMGLDPHVFDRSFSCWFPFTDAS